MRSFMIALGCALMLSACATVNYLTAEYGTADPDKTVKFEDGTGFWIFLHKTRNKMLVSVDPPTASGMGIISGLTYGAASGSPVYAAFDKAAQQALDELRPGCQAVNGKPMERVYYEYTIECPAPPVAQQQKQRRR